MMNRYLFAISLWLVFLPVHSFSQVSYSQHTGLLSVESDSEPLSHILNQISHATGISIFFNPELDRNTSIQIQNQPIETAIKNITRNLNRIFIYEGDALIMLKLFEYSETQLYAEIQKDGNVSRTFQDYLEICEREGYVDTIELEQKLGIAN